MSWTYTVTTTNDWYYTVAEGEAVVATDTSSKPIVTKGSRKYITTKDGKKIITKR